LVNKGSAARGESGAAGVQAAIKDFAAGVYIQQPQKRNNHNNNKGRSERASEQACARAILPPPPAAAFLPWCAAAATHARKRRSNSTALLLRPPPAHPPVRPRALNFFLGFGALTEPGAFFLLFFTWARCSTETLHKYQ